jgi:hypothetical protein
MTDCGSGFSALPLAVSPIVGNLRNGKGCAERKKAELAGGGL